jgi:geranylgeranyl reductase family protein
MRPQCGQSGDYGVMGPRFNNYHDVICVGAGPAGGLVSYLLATRGVSVLLIEQANWPRPKVCGGGLTTRALARLPFDIDAVIEQRIEHVRLAFGEYGSIDVGGGGFGATVDRAAFDALIAQRAREAGAVLRTATRLQALDVLPDGVRARTSSGTHRARLLIGADGAHSSVRRMLFPGYRPDFAIGLEANYRPASTGSLLPSAAHSRVVFDFAREAGSYGWIFPKRDHVNVGLYRLRKPSHGGGLKAALACFAAHIPELSGWVPDRTFAHPIPVCTGHQPVARGRAILIGDAAGLTEAFFGEGISFALESAAIAADWAVAWLESERGDPASGFRNALRPLVNDLRWSHAVANARYRVPARWMAPAARMPSVQNALLDLLAGRASYRRSFWAMPLLLPAALLHRAAPEPV